MFFGRGSSESPETTSADKEAPASKRQEKLRKRQEKGDPRVRAQSGRK